MSPDGLSVHKISLHVYNALNSLFNPLNYDDLYHDVQQYLQRNSKNEASIIERAEKRGYYRINSNPEIKGQLQLEFAPYIDENTITTEENPKDDPRILTIDFEQNN